MKTLARLICLSTAFLVTAARMGAGEPTDSADVQAPRVYDFEKLTPKQAEKLTVGIIRIRVTLWKPYTEDSGETFYTCGGKDVIRIIVFGKNDAPKAHGMGQEFTIAGQLEVMTVEPEIVNGVLKDKGFTVLKLGNAKIAKR